MKLIPVFCFTAMVASQLFVDVAMAIDARTLGFKPFRTECSISSATDVSNGRCILPRSVPVGKRS